MPRFVGRAAGTALAATLLLSGTGAVLSSVPLAQRSDDEPIDVDKVIDIDRLIELRRVDALAAEAAAATAAAQGLVAGAQPVSFSAGGASGIPATVLAAYRAAEAYLATSAPSCRLPWWVLAGIGRIESGHASGGRVDAKGTTNGHIRGVRLDGSLAGTAVITDSDNGALDGDSDFDRAVGPMQFLPATWKANARDGNGDGVADPNNVFDAATSAGVYLCRSGGDLSVPANLVRAVLAYNPSESYVRSVLTWGAAYRDGGSPVADSAGKVPEQVQRQPATPAPRPAPVAAVALAPMAPPARPAAASPPKPAPAPPPASPEPAPVPAPALAAAPAPTTPQPSGEQNRAIAEQDSTTDGASDEAITSGGSTRQDGKTGEQVCTSGGSTGQDGNASEQGSISGGPSDHETTSGGSTGQDVTTEEQGCTWAGSPGEGSTTGRPIDKSEQKRTPSTQTSPRPTTESSGSPTATPRPSATQAVTPQSPTPQTSKAPSTAPQEATVPTVVGQPKDTAITALAAKGFSEVTVVLVDDPSQSKGKVVSTEPESKPNEALPVNTEVTVKVATGKVKVPDLVGLSTTAAADRLAQLGLKCEDSQHVECATVPAGEVASQEQAPGSLVEAGTVVKVKLAASPPSGERKGKPKAAKAEATSPEPPAKKKRGATPHR